MEYVLLAMIVLIVIVAIVASRLADNSYPFPFNKKDVLFTNAEKAFQLLLEKAVGEKYRVINRVKLIDLVSIRNGVSQKAIVKAQNLASGKYLDFVICDRETMQPCGVIDLVNTQGKGYKVTKDWFVSGALEASNIPHVRIKVKSGYTVNEIRQCIAKYIFGGVLPENKTTGRRISPAVMRPRSSLKPEQEAKPSTEITPSLPNRSTGMGALAQLSH